MSNEHDEDPPQGAATEPQAGPGSRAKAFDRAQNLTLEGLGRPPDPALLEETVERIGPPPAAALQPLPGEPPSRAEPARDGEPGVPFAPPANRFETEQEIGRGGNGVVHQVLDLYLRRRVARKTLRHDDGEAADQSARFIEEAQVTGQLDHPNIVPIHDLTPEPGGRVSFTMKLVSGRTLSEVLEEMGSERLEERHLEELLHIMLKVCDAVSFAHSRGVIHRDLKPQNIMIGTHGQVYVMDWGLAAIRHGLRIYVRSPDRIVGTPAFMAPEQAWARPAAYDARTDVYALGGILYRILTNLPPHEGETPVELVRFVRASSVRPPAERRPDMELPYELCRIAMKALSREPAERYQSVGELRAELEQLLRGGGWFATLAVPKGTLIIEQGAPGDAAYVLLKGRAEAFKTVDGERLSLRIMHPPEVFGETAVLTEQPRTSNVVALDDVELKVITRGALERELVRNTWMKALVQALAHRFREVDDKLTTLQQLLKS